MIIDCDFREILSWERGRPARTRPGAASPLSPTWISRQRRRCFPCGWPMQRPTAGTGCGRDARAPRGCGPADDLSIIRRAPRSRSLVSPSYDLPRRGGRGPGSQANGSFPKGTGRLSEKSPAGYPPPLHRDAPPGSAGVPPACCPLGCRSVSLRYCSRPPCRREPHGPGRSRGRAPLPVDSGGGDGRN